MGCGTTCERRASSVRGTQCVAIAVLLVAAALHCAAATADAHHPAEAASNVNEPGDLCEVAVRVLLGETDEPAVDVLLEGHAGDAESIATTDSEGIAVLRLPAGKSQLRAIPRIDMDFSEAAEGFTIAARGHKTARTLRLQPACVFEATVVDDETGMPVEGAVFWKREMRSPRQRRGGLQVISYSRWDSQKRMKIEWVPRTDGSGTARLLLPAGKYEIAAKEPPRPEDRDTLGAVEEMLQEVECSTATPGKTGNVNIRSRVFGAEFIRRKVASVRRAAARVDLHEASLDEALSNLAKQHDVAIRIDRAALVRGGISLEKLPPVTLAWSGSLGSILDRLLGPGGLGYKAAPDALVIVPRGESDKGKRTVRALDELTTVDFQSVELRDALNFLADYHDIFIREDAAAPKAAGIPPKDKRLITLRVSGVSLRSVLKLILEPCGLEAQVIKGELLIVPRATE